MPLHSLSRRLLILAAIAMLACWLLPCVVVFSPELYFDLDPRSDQAHTPITAIGPAGAAIWQTLSLFVAAAALAIHLKVGGQVRWVSVALVGAGMAVCGGHMTSSYANAMQGGAWIAAAALALSALHLAEHPCVRRWIVAGWVGVVVPTALQACWYICVDYPATVALFEQGEAALIQARGWAWGSAEHDLYRRRLLSPDVIGTMGLSNVLGSLLAGLTLLCAALAAGGWWSPGRRVPALCAGVVGAMGVVTIVLTHSRGAALAMCAGALLLGVGLWLLWQGRSVKWMPMWALLAVLAAPAGVGMRGWVGPPGPEVGIGGERSLLFRAQYWQSVPDILISEGGSSVAWGVGPGDFKSAYLVAKNPLNPEEVTSAHNVVVDFVATLGVGGLAWSVVLMAWLWSAGRGLGARCSQDEDDEDEDDSRDVGSQAQRRGGTVLLAAVLFGTQCGYILPQLVVESALWWLLGAVGFVGIMNGMLAPGHIAARWHRLGLFVAATVMLMHNQIEMSFYHAPASALAWGMVAVAAGSVRQRVVLPRQRIAAYGVPACLALAGIACVAGYARPMVAHERALALAHGELQREIPRPYRAIEALALASTIYPSGKTALGWRVRLLMEIAMIARQQRRQDIVDDSLAQIHQALDRAQVGGADPVLVHRLRAQVARAQASPGWRDRAIASMEQVVALNPHGLKDLVWLAQLYHEQGDARQAGRLARRALKASEQSYLDPAKQLDEATRAELELWLFPLARP